MSSVTTLTGDDFDSFTSQGGVVLVDFWAPWCGPCKRIGPIVDELAGEMTDVKFGKLNTDENQAAAAGHGVMSIPTLMIYKDGEKVDSIVGALPKPALQAALQKHL